MKPLEQIRFGVGPMSKNVVDACIDFANRRGPLMLIPSRRQVEWTGGYVNGWTTEGLARYVLDLTDRITLVRDHAGPGQGDQMDDGLESLDHDCRWMNMIHIDPWKTAVSFQDGCERTKGLIEYCHARNPLVKFEIGTEEAIFPYQADQLERLITWLKWQLRPAAFNQITYAVIQSGTALRENENTGSYDPGRLDDMLEVCKQHGLLAKAHNGDYLAAATTKDMVNRGLDAINIAPEFGQIETRTYLAAITDDEELTNRFYSLCYGSDRWRKWMDAERAGDRMALINATGHYVFSHPAFISEIRASLPGIDTKIRANLTRRLEELHGSAS